MLGDLVRVVEHDRRTPGEVDAIELVVEGDIGRPLELLVEIRIVRQLAGVDLHQQIRRRRVAAGDRMRRRPGRRWSRRSPASPRTSRRRCRRMSPRR